MNAKITALAHVSSLALVGLSTKALATENWRPSQGTTSVTKDLISSTLLWDNQTPADWTNSKNAPSSYEHEVTILNNDYVTKADLDILNSTAWESDLPCRFRELNANGIPWVGNSGDWLLFGHGSACPEKIQNGHLYSIWEVPKSPGSTATAAVAVDAQLGYWLISDPATYLQCTLFPNSPCTNARYYVFADPAASATCRNAAFQAPSQSSTAWTSPESCFDYSNATPSKLTPGMGSQNGNAFWMRDNDVSAKMISLFNSYDGYYRLGAPTDNGGGYYAHSWLGTLVQDFYNPGTPHFGAGDSLITYSTAVSEAHLLHDGFLGEFRTSTPSVYGAAVTDEYQDGVWRRQDFEQGQCMLWQSTTGVVIGSMGASPGPGYRPGSFLCSVVEDKRVHVDWPNGGELLSVGIPYTVRWTTAGSIDFVRVDLLQGRTIITPLAAKQPNGNTGGSLEFIPLPQFAGQNYTIGVSDYDDGNIYDVSDAEFSVVATGGVPGTGGAGDAGIAGFGGQTGGQIGRGGSSGSGGGVGGASGSGGGVGGASGSGGGVGGASGTGGGGGYTCASTPEVCGNHRDDDQNWEADETSVCGADPSSLLIVRWSPDTTYQCAATITVSARKTGTGPFTDYCTVSDTRAVSCPISAASGGESWEIDIAMTDPMNGKRRGCEPFGIGGQRFGTFHVSWDASDMVANIQMVSDTPNVSCDIRVDIPAPAGQKVEPVDALPDIPADLAADAVTGTGGIGNTSGTGGIVGTGGAGGDIGSGGMGGATGVGGTGGQGPLGGSVNTGGTQQGGGGVTIGGGGGSASGGAGGTVLVPDAGPDSAGVDAPLSLPNLLRNPGFESGTQYWDWWRPTSCISGCAGTASDCTALCSAEVAAGVGRDGTVAAKLLTTKTSNCTNCFLYQPAVTVTKGKSYQIRFWAMTADEVALGIGLREHCGCPDLWGATRPSCPPTSTCTDACCYEAYWSYESSGGGTCSTSCLFASGDNAFIALITDGAWHQYTVTTSAIAIAGADLTRNDAKLSIAFSDTVGTVFLDDLELNELP